MKNKSTKKHSGMITIAIAVGLLAVFLGIKEVNLKAEKKELENTLSKLEADYNEENERSIELFARKAYMKTKKYIEDIAREKLGLVYEGETIFKEKDDDDSE